MSQHCKDGETITAKLESDDFGPVLVDMTWCEGDQSVGINSGFVVEKVVVDNDDCEDFPRGSDVTTGVSDREKDSMAYDREQAMLDWLSERHPEERE